MQPSRRRGQWYELHRRRGSFPMLALDGRMKSFTPTSSSTGISAMTHEASSALVAPDLMENRLAAEVAPLCPRAPIAMLGVAFDNVTVPEAIDRIGAMIASRQPHYVVTANVDFLVQARADVELRRILLDAHLVLCDGTPLLWASRWLGNRLAERVAGADLVPLLIREAQFKRHRIFFLGATPESAAAAAARLRDQYPDAAIAGHYSPPFRTLLEMDHTEIKRRIAEARPDLLFVAFGCPKAEKWIAMHYRALGVPVAIGVGATIDFLAGRVRRAPQWMRRCGTEWVFRLLQEPRRLLRRYARDLWFFGWNILEQSLRLRGARAVVAEGHKTITQPPLIKLPRHFDAGALRAEPHLQNPASEARRWVVDMSGVESIDSTGVGVLMAWHKKLRQANGMLVLVAPGPAVNRALRLMRLRDVFLCVPDLPAAQKLLRERDGEEPLQVIEETFATGAKTVILRGEITAANVEYVWQLIQPCLAAPRQAVVMDLSGVSYIDSSGLGLLLRAKKLTQSRESTLALVGLQPAVQNVLRLARLEGYLLGA
jgi:N-acetylglucosaminyldiphosphoundecaprenol N-acetyl-beta-D-mannosaminyltransferase